MSTNFEQGQTLGQGDLDIFLTDSSGNPINAYQISYAIYFVDPSTGVEALIGPKEKIPANPTVGEYYAAMRIPGGAEIGCYRIRWLFRQTSTSSQEGAVQQFGVIGTQQISVDPYTPCVRNLINKLRILTRDHNPDKYYRFMPPEGEGRVGCYNQVFGFIWEDAEFAEYLEMALWKWNMQAPNTDSSYPSVESICQRKQSWQAALLWGSLVTAAQALVYNWIANEFSYSIGGISLDVEKSSKYESMKQNAEEQWDKLVEMKARTSKYLRGLQQPRFGRGVRSAFGPYTGRGILSPRNFVIFLLSLSGAGYSMVQEVVPHAHTLSSLLA